MNVSPLAGPVPRAARRNATPNPVRVIRNPIAASCETWMVIRQRGGLEPPDKTLCRQQLETQVSLEPLDPTSLSPRMLPHRTQKNLIPRARPNCLNSLDLLTGPRCALTLGMSKLAYAVPL